MKVLRWIESSRNRFLRIAVLCPFLFAAAAPAGAGYRDIILADQPFAYWRLGEQAGTLAEEETGLHPGGYENNPVLGVAGATVDGQSAVRFDGIDDRVRVPLAGTSVAGFGSRLNRFSVELWYRSTGSAGPLVLLGTQNASQNIYFAVEREPGRFVLKIRDTGGGTPMSVRMSDAGSAILRDGSFHHAVWVVSNANLAAAAVYLDGRIDLGAAVVDAGGADGAFADFDRDLAIGAVNSQGVMAQPIDAVLDEVALYDDALNPDQIREHYIHGIAAGYALEVLKDDPFAYWRLDERPAPAVELLLDSRIIEDLDNAELRVGQVAKHPSNPLFGEDQPWEDRLDNVYPNVLYDEDESLYKAWYFVRTANPRSDALGYATSIDGLQWTKPIMDIVIWNGQQTSLVAQHVHGAGVIKDLRDPDDARRYKMFFKGQVIAVRFSPDGLHWAQFVDNPQVEAAGDTANNALWVPGLGKYVGMTRLWTDQRRIVGRTESTDFTTWSKAVEVLRGEPLFDTYSMPVFPWGDIFIGFPSIYDEQADRVHVELTWSPDTLNWYRVDQGAALIPNATTPGAYDWGTAYAAKPIVVGDMMRIYYGGGDWGHFDPNRSDSLCLAELRMHGFAGYHPLDGVNPAVVTTRPFPLGTEVGITADAAGGTVTAVLEDDQGTPLRTSVPVTADVTGQALAWVEGPIDPLVGQSVRLRITFTSAVVYAIHR